MTTLQNKSDFYTGTDLNRSAIHRTSPSLEFNSGLDFILFIPLEVCITLSFTFSLVKSSPSLKSNYLRVQAVFLCLSMMTRRKYFTVLQMRPLCSTIYCSTKTHRCPMHIQSCIALMNPEISSTSYRNTINLHGTAANWKSPGFLRTNSLQLRTQ